MTRVYCLIKDELEKITRYDYEILFEDNCSTDDTEQRLRKLPLTTKM